MHPLVTLLEKLEAISRRFEAAHDPAGYVRHYEDAARLAGASLPDLDQSPVELYELMHGTSDLRRDLQVEDLAFTPGDGPAWQALEKAHAEIGHMFWGSRVTLQAACEAIRAWLAQSLPPRSG